MVKIGLFIHNIVLYNSIKPVLESFKGIYKIYVPIFTDSNWEKMASHTFRYLLSIGENVERIDKFPLKDKLIISLSGMPYYFIYQARYNIKFLYGIAKESWGYDVYNLYYDYIFTYGVRELEFLKSYSRPITVGPLKFIDYEFPTIKKVKGSKLKILYMPTYGNLSSIDNLANTLLEIKDDFEIKIKLHHGTSFLEPERVERIKGVGEIYDHTYDTNLLFYWADIVLSDASGSIFDAIYCKKKILVYQPIKPDSIDDKHKSIEQIIIDNNRIASFSDPNKLRSSIYKVHNEDLLSQNELRNELFPISPKSGLREAINILEFCLNANNEDNYKVTHDMLINEFRKKIETENKLMNLESQLQPIFKEINTNRKMIDLLRLEIDSTGKKFHNLINSEEFNFGSRFLKPFKKYGINKLLLLLLGVKKVIKDFSKIPNRVIEYISTRKVIDAEIKQLNENSYKSIMIVFQTVPWNYRIQRLQHLINEFSRRNYYVVLIDFNSSKEKSRVNKIGKNILQLTLKNEQPLDIYSSPLNSKTIQSYIKQLTNLLDKLNPRNTFIYYSNFPGWIKLILRLKKEFGGRIIFDWIDDNTSFKTNGSFIGELEKEIIQQSDYVLTTSKILKRKALALNANTTLVRNAANIEHFYGLKADYYKIRKKFGYIGAISDWFDIDLIINAAIEKSDWEFYLIGRSDIDLGVLKFMPNIKIIGEVPYSQLGRHLKQFEIGLIPFKKSPLTDATNPVKMYEYLAAGKKVLAFYNEETFEALGELGVYRDYEDFIKKAENIMINPKEIKYPINIKEETWENRFKIINEVLSGKENSRT